MRRRSWPSLQAFNYLPFFSSPKVCRSVGRSTDIGRNNGFSVGCLHPMVITRCFIKAPTSPSFLLRSLSFPFAAHYIGWLPLVPAPSPGRRARFSSWQLFYNTSQWFMARNTNGGERTEWKTVGDWIGLNDTCMQAETFFQCHLRLCSKAHRSNDTSDGVLALATDIISLSIFLSAELLPSSASFPVFSLFSFAFGVIYYPWLIFKSFVAGWLTPGLCTCACLVLLLEERPKLRLPKAAAVPVWIIHKCYNVCLANSMVRDKKEWTLLKRGLACSVVLSPVARLTPQGNDNIHT